MIEILHLEDNPDDALLLERALKKAGLKAQFVVAPSPLEYITALQSRRFSLILSDNGVLGLDAAAAVQQARKAFPAIPFICVTGSRDPEAAAGVLAAGADTIVCKDDTENIISALRHYLPDAW